MRIVEQLLAHKGTEVWHVPPEATVYEAVQLMCAKNIGAVLVCRGAHLLGIFSERDCMRQVTLQGRDPREIDVASVMSTELTTVTPHDTVAACMHLMTDQRLRHLPVLEDGMIAGLISIGDVVKAQLSDQEELISGLESYIHGTALPPSL